MRSEARKGAVSSRAVPSNPNSRLGRLRSPFAQGWYQMEAMVVGVDVSKDRLDVVVRTTGENFLQVLGKSQIIERASSPNHEGCVVPNQRHPLRPFQHQAGHSRGGYLFSREIYLLVQRQHP